MGLEGPSRTIVVEPVKQPTTPPRERERPAEPAPTRAPEREKVPA